MSTSIRPLFVCREPPKRKRRNLLFALLALGLLATYLVCAAFTGGGEASETQENDADLAGKTESLINELDISELEAYLSTLSDESVGAIAPNGLKARLKAMVSGDFSVDAQSIGSYIAGLLGASVRGILPVVLGIIAVSLAFNVLSGLRGKFASDSVQTIVYFACVSLIIALLFSQVLSVTSAVRTFVEGLQTQMRLFFPILLTLMTAVGAGSSVAVYKPAVAILSNGIITLLTAVILPLLLVSLVLTAVGHLSDAVKLGKLADFFSSAAKWLLGTTFFLFSAVMAVQGITASVYDGVSVRTAKFALGKYVPIIGGYLSDGLNLVMAGSVLVKNALGATGLLLLAVSALPLVVRIAVLTLGLKFAAAIAEPLGDGKISGMVFSIAKTLTLLVSVVLAAVFLYLIFLVLLICTGNLAL